MIYPQATRIIFLICLLAATGNLWAVSSKASVPMGEPELFSEKAELAVFREQLKERYGKTEFHTESEHQRTL